MIWNKLGLVFDAKAFSTGGWFCNSALTPQPYRVSEDIIRVAEKPILDIGRDGCFDDNGLILGDVVDGPDGIYLFYVGFQLVKKAKFLVFSGVAVSDDNGNQFRRISEAPILGRAVNQTTIGAISQRATRMAYGDYGLLVAMDGK